MSNIHSAEEAWEHLAETLNYLSKHGESVVLHNSNPPMISGFSGGVRFIPGNEWGKGWESYKEG